jgi:hypothetical protein
VQHLDDNLNMCGIATKFVARLLSEQQRENMSTRGRALTGGLKVSRDFFEDNHRCGFKGC